VAIRGRERDAKFLGRQGGAAADYVNDNFPTQSDRLCRRANPSACGASDRTVQVRLTGTAILSFILSYGNDSLPGSYAPCLISHARDKRWPQRQWRLVVLQEARSPPLPPMGRELFPNWMSSLPRSPIIKPIRRNRVLGSWRATQMASC